MCLLSPFFSDQFLFWIDDKLPFEKELTIIELHLLIVYWGYGARIILRTRIYELDSTPHNKSDKYKNMNLNRIRHDKNHMIIHSGTILWFMDCHEAIRCGLVKWIIPADNKGPSVSGYIWIEWSCWEYEILT
jgi:hypothetical protein